MEQNEHNADYKDCRVVWLLLTMLVALKTENDKSTAHLSHAMNPGVPL